MPYMILQEGFNPESLRHPYLKWIRMIEDENILIEIDVNLSMET